MISTEQKRRPLAFSFALAVSITALTVLALAFAPRAEAFVYWANVDDDGTGMSIARAGVDGSGLNPTFVSGGSPSVCGVAVDAGHVYWANLESGTIGRANLDGTGVTQSFITGADRPCGPVVDGAHIYWGNQTTVGRANLDGTQVNQSFITGSAATIAVAVDGAHIYWANSGTGRDGSIGRANLDGSGVNQRLIAVTNPSGVAVDAAHIYWTDFFSGAVGRANLDGTGANQTFITGGNLSQGVAVDAAHIYWNNNFVGPTGFDDDAIARANLDGSGVNQQFITGNITSPSGVAVDALDAAYPRPGSATPKRDALVPAYRQCTAPNRTHGVPFNSSSCNPPAQASNFLTVSTVGRASGFVKTRVLLDNPNTAADEADVALTVNATDVLRKSDLSDYSGQLQAQASLRITDRSNGPSLSEPATVSDRTLSFAVPCTTTPAGPAGSTCAANTTVDALNPGAVLGGKSSIWDLGQVRVFDGGADGLASTADNTLFLVSGVFIP